MPANYVPVPSATQAPATAPTDGVGEPVLSLPVDGDPLVAASVEQPFEALADASTWLTGANGDNIRGLSRSFDGPSNPTAPADLLNHSQTLPMSSLDVLPRFITTGSYDVGVTAGVGWIYDEVGTPANISPFHRVAWDDTTVTHAAPVTNNRTDIIVLDQSGVVSVVTGTPGPTYPPPATPAGSIVLFYVFVPLAAATSADFLACRGTWRRLAAPWAGCTGILSGCNLFWDTTTDPTTTSAPISMGAPDFLGSSYLSLHRVLIDGELLEWYGLLSSATGGRTADTTANPFGTPAPAGNDRPYYVYLVGGRHNPMNSLCSPASTGIVVHLNPVIMVESTVPPNVYTGKPTGNMTVNGVTVTPDGAVYVGIGFVVANTTRRRACVVNGDMTYTAGPMQSLIKIKTIGGLELVGNFATGCQPSISTKLRASVVYLNNGGAVGSATLKINALAVLGGYEVSTPPAAAASGSNLTPVDFSWNAQSGSEIWAAAPTGDQVSVIARGFNHRVLRYGGAW